MTNDDEPGFLRENWPWILLPALGVVAVLAWFLLTGDGEVAPFQYGGF